MNRAKAKKVQKELERQEAETAKSIEDGSKQRQAAVSVLKTYATVVPLTDMVKQALEVAIVCTASIDYHMGIKK